jgi:hypothetical protein
MTKTIKTVYDYCKSSQKLWDIHKLEKDEIKGVDSSDIIIIESLAEVQPSEAEVEEIVKNKTKGVCYLLHHHLHVGSYDDPCVVALSNVRLFLKEFEGHENIKHIEGAYDYEVIVIDINCEDAAIIEMLDYLDVYSTIDHTHADDLEQEIIEQSWDKNIKQEFIKALKEKFSLVICDIEAHEEQLKELYYQLQVLANEYPKVEAGVTASIDINKLLEHLENAPDYLK